MDHGQVKPMMTLVRPEFIEGVAKVMTFGVSKYGKYGYRKTNESYMEMLDGVYRHLGHFTSGRDVDEESGLSNLLHAAARINILLDLQRLKLGKDDRSPNLPYISEGAHTINSDMYSCYYGYPYERF